MFGVLNYRPETTSANLAFQSQHIFRAGADEVQTQQTST